MAGADEGGDRLLVDLVLLEADSLILRLDRRTGPDLTIPLADAHGNMGDLPAPFLAALDPAAQMLKRLNKEALDVVRLKTLCLGAFHIKPQLLDPGLGHGIVGQRAAAQQFEQVRLVDRAIDLLEETRFDIFPLAILYRLEQQILERHAVEQFTEHVIDAPAQRLARCLQLFKKPGIHLALTRIGGDEIPQMANLGLTDAVDAAEPLFDLVRVPWQVVIDHEVATLKVHAFAGRIIGDEDKHVLVLHEALDDFASLFA